MTDEPSSDLERAAPHEHGASVWLDLGLFLWQNKSWWLMPVVLALGVLGLAIVMAGSAAAPFIYTLF
jgi:hypothetical protein